MRKWLCWLVVIFVAMFTACDSKTPATVTAATPARADAPSPAPAAPSEYVASGPLTVENQVDVPAQREGVIAQLLAHVGQHVRQGELLAELDSRQLAAERDAAQADVYAYQANLDNWIAETKVLESDYSRDQALWNAQLITAQQLQHSKYKLESAKFQITRDQENVKFAKAKLRAAEAEFDKTRVLAPFDGVVARRYVQLGQKVGIGDRVFWVTALSPIDVRFTVPQEFAGRLKSGEEVSVISPAAPGQAHSARISMVTPVVDPASGTIEVQARVTDPGPDLLPGMTVSIKLPKR